MTLTEQVYHSLLKQLTEAGYEDGPQIMITSTFLTLAQKRLYWIDKP